MIKKAGEGTICPVKNNILEYGQSSGMDLKLEKPSILLHSCCGPCSTAVIERLMDDYSITVFFYNPNITDEDEYRMRLEAQKQVIDYFNDKRMMMDKISLIEGEYNAPSYMRNVKGFEEEQEGGARCSICFRMRLEAAAKEALQKGFDTFTTTLTVSPHKNYKIISEIGHETELSFGIPYLDMDFKKKAGFQRSIELSKEIGIYRQNYCGCEFSKWFLK